MQEKIDRINNTMGWLVTLVIAFFTALTYPIRYFWVKGIADYYKMDVLYVYGNYNTLIGDVINTIICVFAVLIIAYFIVKWIMKLKEKWAIIGKSCVIFGIIVLLNLLTFIIPNFSQISKETILVAFSTSFYLGFVECLIIFPNAAFLYYNLEVRNENRADKGITWKRIGTFILWIICVFIASYSFSNGQVKKCTQYEIIEVNNDDRVIVSKYQNMFYTYDCDVIDKKMTIYTNSSMMIGMEDKDVKRLDFEQIIIE